LAEDAEIAELDIARPDNKKLNMLNDKRIKSCKARFNNGAYSRLQFLRAVRHSVGAHTDTLQPRNDSSRSSEDDDEDEVSQAPMSAATTSAASESPTVAAASTSDDCCEVCLVAPRAGFVLVPCGHARFCEPCAFPIWLPCLSCGYWHGDAHLFLDHTL